MASIETCQALWGREAGGAFPILRNFSRNSQMCVSRERGRVYRCALCCVVCRAAGTARFVSAVSRAGAPVKRAVLCCAQSTSVPAWRPGLRTAALACAPGFVMGATPSGIWVLLEAPSTATQPGTTRLQPCPHRRCRPQSMAPCWEIMAMSAPATRAGPCCFRWVQAPSWLAARPTLHDPALGTAVRRGPSQRGCLVAAAAM